MLATFALCDEKTHLRLNDAEKRPRLAQMLKKAAFFSSSPSSSTIKKLYVSLTFALAEVYANNTIIQTDVHHQIPPFLRLWLKTIAVRICKYCSSFFDCARSLQEWNIVDEVATMIKWALESFASAHIPLTLLYMLRKLTQRYAIPTTGYTDAILTSSALDAHAKLRFVSALTPMSVPSELVEEMSDTNWPFILSLERTVTRMHNEQDSESIALVLLAELKEKSENEQLEWLFAVDG